jgi:hypothetical protein
MADTALAHVVGVGRVEGSIMIRSIKKRMCVIIGMITVRWPVVPLCEMARRRSESV